jgi:Zn-dependent peptidase ImmA (M78 family)
MTVRKKRIGLLVQTLLQELKISSPPVPVEKIAKSHGVTIVQRSLDDGVSGFLYPGKDGKPAIGVNTFHSTTRQRFTVAHELGHLLLHDYNDVHVDPGDFVIHFRDEVSSSGADREEREANLFAAELLMPASFLRRDLRALNSLRLHDDLQLRPIAKRYGVSLQALMLRLTNLGFLDSSAFGS